jgi:hypothetical protein
MELSNFTPDPLAPVASFSVEEGGVVPSSDGNYFAELVGNDEGSSVVLINYRIDGGEWLLMAAPDFEFWISGYSSHTVEFYSEDAAGNVEAPSKMASFTIVPVP